MANISVDILTQLQDSDPEIREAALDEIGTLNPPNALELIEPFLSDKSAQVRATAACNLGDIQNQEAIVYLISAARQDDDAEVRFQALSALAEYHRVDILNALIDEVFHGEPLRMTRQAVASQLGNYDDEKAIDALITLLQDNDSHVLIPVVDSLFKLNRPRLKAVWQELLCSSFHPYLVSVAAQALGDLENLEPFEVIDSFHQALSPEMRSAAAYALAWQKDERAIPILLELAQKDSDENVRDVSINALSEYYSAQIGTFLVHAVKSKKLSLRAKESIAEQLRFYKTSESIKTLNWLRLDSSEVVRTTAIHSLRHLRAKNGTQPVESRQMRFKHHPRQLESQAA